MNDTDLKMAELDRLADQRAHCSHPLRELITVTDIEPRQLLDSYRCMMPDCGAVISP